MTAAAMRLHGGAALRIDPRGHGFEMREIAAQLDAAEVIDLQSWSDGTVGEYPRHTMRIRPVIVECGFAVAVPVSGAGPRPARIRSSRPVDAGPEPA